ncbi:MAG: NAD-dependent deacetylase [Treponema sp.]|jgi:NAD-dependent deacetylase|nr:NAD-dependent deacetylase [Treponema sp.]
MTSAALLRRIAASRHCAALTGAGVSVLSGIRDFRGKNGFYTKPDTDFPPERIFDIDWFEKDPSLFYRYAGPLVYTVHEKEPSVVHTVLAELESRGFLKAVITQNIDMLHQKAGSRRVIEVHGSPRIHYCLRCPGIRVGYEEAAALVKAGDMPRCPRCGRVLKPAVTFFGEPLPLDARREAETGAQDADLLLVLGTSLTVRPAADIPHTTLRCGGALAIVNDTPTPLDGNTIFRAGDLEEVFGELRGLLISSPGFS